MEGYWGWIGTSAINQVIRQLLSKEQGNWQIVAFQNMRISEMPAAAQAARRLTN
jgi:hypothetical protein